MPSVAARVRAGVPATVPTTTGEYLTDWLAGRRGLSPKTIRGYGDHIRSYDVDLNEAANLIPREAA